MCLNNDLIFLKPNQTILTKKKGEVAGDNFTNSMVCVGTLVVDASLFQAYSNPRKVDESGMPSDSNAT